MKTLTIANQKGGVGKTTLGLHLAFNLLEQGNRVLFIDLDPQGNSSKTLDQYKTFVPASALFMANTGKDIEAANFQLIPASAELIDVDRKPWEVMAHLANNLALVDDQFDYCLIDTAPTMGLRLTASLIAADYVLSPIEVEEYSLDGLQKLLKTIFSVKKNLNPKLEFLGIAVNRFNSRNDRQIAAFKALAAQYGSYILPQPIGIRKSIPEALSDGIPVWQLGKQNTAARVAGKEILTLLDMVHAKIASIQEPAHA